MKLMMTIVRSPGGVVCAVLSCGEGGIRVYNIYLHSWALDKRVKGIYETLTVIMSSGIIGDFIFFLILFIY